MVWSSGFVLPTLDVFRPTRIVSTMLFSVNEACLPTSCVRLRNNLAGAVSCDSATQISVYSFYPPPLLLLSCTACHTSATVLRHQLGTCASQSSSTARGRDSTSRFKKVHKLMSQLDRPLPAIALPNYPLDYQFRVLNARARNSRPENRKNVRRALQWMRDISSAL